ncbi:hypothetical protein CTM_19614 [Clostridium tetanomorphum DSM 665]|nr:hypothetical protein CTM_19614 [Clostridium tetanomorphum DSM 665]SQC00231.1 Uncharacterised protein [Clostridium tetanomorphum]
MKKIFRYFQLKISSFNVILILGILLIYQFCLFLNLIIQHKPFNFYDLLIEDFSYLSLFFIISILYLILIYKVSEKTNFYKYLFLKFESKYKVYNANVFSVFMFSIIFVLCAILIAIIQCFTNISFNNVWSSHFFSVMTGKINLFYSNEAIKIVTSKLTPLTYVLYTTIFVILYLFTLAMIFLVSNICFKKRELSFIVVIGIIIANMFLDSSSGIIGRLTFTRNIFFITASILELQDYTFIIYRICYWLSLISILYLIGKLSIKNFDYNFGE